MLESPEIDGRASNACNVQRFRNGVLGSPGRDVTGDVPASIDDISSPRKELRLRISVFRRNWSTTGSLTSDNLYRLPVAVKPSFELPSVPHADVAMAGRWRRRGVEQAEGAFRDDGLDVQGRGYQDRALGDPRRTIGYRKRSTPSVPRP